MPFERFGSAHLLAMALAVTVPLALAWIVRASNSAKLAKAICHVLAGMLIANEMIVLVAFHFQGTASFKDILPMHLCDWALVASVITLLWPGQVVYELAFFWAIAGSSMAVLTPDVQFGFANLGTLLFFIAHCGVIASMLYVTFALRMRLYLKSLPRIFAISQIYLAAAFLINFLLKTNYGYLRAKPQQPSLLDYLGPWPLYILSIEVVGALALLIIYAPFFISDKVSAHRS
jgi:hypothetical integral membrane protein (TIGR02206 family)